MPQSPLLEKLHRSWHPILQPILDKPYMQALRDRLQTAYQAGKTIYPSKDNIFKAFELTPFNKVSVVILGQDPYHGPEQAHGLSFSVRKGMALPPSLQNIYKELESDLQCPRPNGGDLTDWAKQGVLLLNSVLTVEARQAASHQGWGWETFTDEVIAALDAQAKRKVFVLWGSYAQKKGRCIQNKKHLVLQSVHPSPLSAHRGFFGSKPFSKINHFLEVNKLKTIDWLATEMV